MNFNTIPHLEVWVWHTIRESSHANPDSFQHTITGKLVHNKRWLNVTGLLVGVGDQAADKVRLTAVESGHELSKRDKIDRGDSFATTTLLLLLSFILWCSCWLARVISPQVFKKLAC